VATDAAATTPPGASLRVELVAPAARARLPADQPVPLRVHLTRDSQAVRGAPGVFVTAVIVYPGDGGEDIVRLRDDGKLGDARAGDGEWTAWLRGATTPGAYRLRLKVSETGHETLLASTHTFTVRRAPPPERSQERPQGARLPNWTR
jgi:hypothetical protein